MHKCKLLLTAAALSACLLLTACDKKVQAQGAKTPPIVTVTLAPARLDKVQRTVDVVGTLFADEESVVSAKVPGRIIKLYKDIGDSVQPGEPLVQLKPNDYLLAVNKAQLAMEQALAKVGLKELPPKDFDVTKVPTVVKARLQAENAQAKYNRAKKLFEATPPLMSEQDYADLATALSVAQSSYDVELLVSRGLVAEAWSLKGDLDIAQQRLTDATTRAPSTIDPKDLSAGAGTPPEKAKRSFVVTHKYVNEGELVREITPCFRLIDDNPIKLRAKVPERYVADIAIGQKVKANVDAYPGTDFLGAVSRINPQVDADNRTFSIEVLIPNDDHRLKPGSFSRAAVQTHVDNNVVFAPQNAIITFAGVTKVFKVESNKAAEVSIETGEAQSADNRYVEIVRGLKGNEQLVIEGASKLAGGMTVSIKAPATQASTQPASKPATP